MVMALPAGSTAIQGWTVMGAAIEYVDEQWSALEGTRSLALNGTNPGGIAQSFLTVSGQPYQVKFFLSGDPFSGVKHVRAAAAGQSQDYAFDAEHVWPWGMGWAENTFDFTANAGTTTLTFTSLDAGDTGPVLDSVVVTGPSPVGVDDRSDFRHGFALAGPIPNPSPEGVAVSFTVPVATPLRLIVLDARGRTLRVLAAGAFEPGVHARVWDGRIAAGNRAPAGLYFIRLSAPGGIDLVQKAVLVR
jgi:choice-of-anchor C domain-containing protein